MIKNMKKFAIHFAVMSGGMMIGGCDGGGKETETVGGVEVGNLGAMGGLGIGGALGGSNQLVVDNPFGPGMAGDHLDKKPLVAPLDWGPRRNNVPRGTRLHFKLPSEVSELRRRGKISFANMDDKTFVISAVNLLLHATPLRTELARLATQATPVTHFSYTIYDLVDVFNHAWGDAWSLTSKIDISRTLFKSLVDRLLSGLEFGFNDTDNDGTGPTIVLQKLLKIIELEYSGMALYGQIPRNPIADMFRHRITRRAQHEDTPGHCSLTPTHDKNDLLVRISAPKKVVNGDPKMDNTHDITELILSRYLLRDPAWEDFVECGFCHKPIKFDTLRGYFHKSPSVLFISLKNDDGVDIVVDPTIEIPTDSTGSGQITYNLSGYIGQSPDGKYATTVSNPDDPREWYHLNEHGGAMLRSGPLAIPPNEKIHLLMYIKAAE